MAVVELGLPPLAEHVRTARLVVVAAARRAELSADLVDELRLALGEACARAMRLNAASGVPVRVRVEDDATGLRVTVQDTGSTTGASEDVADDLLADSHDDDHVDPEVALAVLAGLVDDVRVEPADRGGTVITMRWPLPPRVPGGHKPTQAAQV